MGSHGSKEGSGTEPTRAKSKTLQKSTGHKGHTLQTTYQPDQIEVLKVVWKSLSHSDDLTHTATFDSLLTFLALPTDLISFVERIFVEICSHGNSETSTRVLKSTQDGKDSPASPPVRDERFNFQQFVSMTEHIHRSARSHEKAAFLARLYAKEDQTLGKSELARMFTDLTLLLTFVSEYEMTNYLPNNNGNNNGAATNNQGASPNATKPTEEPAVKPSTIIIDEEDNFSNMAETMVSQLTEEERSPQPPPPAESSTTAAAGITMSKLNIQIPTVKGGVSVNPMNESRVVEEKKVVTEEELQKMQIERDMRTTRRIIYGLMKSAFEFSVKKIKKSGGDVPADAESTMGAADFVEWVCEVVPGLVEPLSNLFHFKFFQLASSFSEESKKTYKPVAMVPVGLDMDKSDLWGNGMIWALDLLFTEKKSVWKMLYNSDAHGHSMNRFVHHVVGYDGPSIMFIRDSEGHLFGAYISSAWQISSKYGGDNNAFLFSLDPSFSTRHPSGPEKNFVYCFDRKNTHSGFPVGIGFGGTLNAFRLCLQDDLATGMARQMDTTYEIGVINPTAAFEVDLIEVWGCGGDAAEMALARSNYVRTKMSERARKVNRAQAAQGWMNGPDKFIMDLLGKTGSSDAYHDEIKLARKNMKKAQEASAQK